MKKESFTLNYALKKITQKGNFKDSLTVDIMKDFILELGKDFTFIDEEYRVQVGGDDFRIDLLFFHRVFYSVFF